MKKKYNRSAIISLGLGLAAIFLALTRAGGAAVVAIPVGIAAIINGCVAVWLIHRRGNSVRGTGQAVSGAFLGALGILASVPFIAGMFVQQFDQRQQQQHRLQRAMAVNPMSDEPTTNFTSNLPIIVLHTAGQFISKEAQAIVRAEFFEAELGKRRASLGAKPQYEGKAAIHLRGSSTMDLPKHSYTFHTLDNKTNQTKVSLLGLPKEEDWVLYAPFEDKTMIRDVLAFQLANQMGRYAPRTRYVELFINDSNGAVSMRHYAGVYILMEKIKRGPQRVNIAKLDPEQQSEPEITGGYIIKRDHSERHESRFRTDRGGPYFYVYPTAQKITSKQKAWLKHYLNSFEGALYGDDFKDPQEGYAAYLDVNSFIDEHWLVEMSKNVDGFRYSAFLTKDRGGKLMSGPPWDWNRSFGNANYYGGGKVNGWYSSNLRHNEISWYQRLREDPAFTRACSARWIELRTNVFDPEKINATIDKLAAQLGEAQERNFQRWPILGQHLSCNYYVGNSYEDEVRWLKNWIQNRIAWIDGQIELPAK